MLRNFVPSTDKIYQWDFSKVAVAKRSTKGESSAPFVERLVLNFYQQKIDKNVMLRNFAPSTDKIY